MILRKIFLLVLLYTLSPCSLDGQVSQQDSLALVALYDSTGGPDWWNNSNWLTSAPVSTWHGITVEDTNVVEINLNQNGISGSLPEEISNLSELAVLNLRSNNLVDPIPESFGTLNNLIKLDLAHNNFSGSLPDAIGNLTNLNFLNLGANNFSDSLPYAIGNLTNLEELYLFENQFTGNIPDSLTNLINLTKLSLSGNNLSGDIESLANLTNLTKLFLSFNNLSGAIPNWLANLNNITILDLSNNNFEGSIPEAISQLTNLNSLQLNSNELTDTIPESIAQLNNLVVLHLYDNNLEGTIPALLGEMVSLTSLDLSDNGLDGFIPDALGNLVNLTTLNLSGNYLSGEIPSSMANLISMESLILSNNLLSGAVPSNLQDLTNLVNIYLASNAFSGIPDFGASENLEQFICNFNELHFSLLEPIIAHPNFDNFLEFNYAPQTITPPPITGQSGAFYDSTIVLSVPSDGTQTQYTWYKDGIEVTDNDGVDTTFTFTVSTVLQGGEYSVEYTHPVLDQLSYTSLSHEVFIFGVDSLGGVYIPNQLIVEFDPGTTASYRDSLRLLLDATLIDSCKCGEQLQVWEFDSLEYNPLGIPDSLGLFAYFHDPNEIKDKVKDDFACVDNTGFNYETRLDAKTEEQKLLMENSSLQQDAFQQNVSYSFPHPSPKGKTFALTQSVENCLHQQTCHDVGGISITCPVLVSGSEQLAPNSFQDQHNLSRTRFGISILANQQITPPSDTIQLAILDTGIRDTLNLGDYFWQNPDEDGTDPDSNCLIDYSGYDFVGNGPPDAPTNHLHASQMAAIALQNAGTCGTLQFQNIKAFDTDGRGNIFDAICGTYYAMDKGASVINMSWSYYGQPISILENALIRADDQDILVVASAGNGIDSNGVWLDTLPFYPAAFDLSNLVSVAAADGDVLADFSNLSDSLAVVAAPGVGMEPWPGGGVISGTSGAAAFVSGMVASYRQAFPDENVTEVLETLQSALLPMASSAQGTTVWNGRLAPLTLSVNTADIDAAGNPGYAVVDTLWGGIPPYEILWSTGEMADSIAISEAGDYSVTVTDLTCHEVVQDFAISQIIATKEGIGLMAFKVFPNPAEEGVFVLWEGQSLDGFAQLYSAQQQLQSTHPLASQTTYIDLSDLPKGIYFLKMQQGDGRFEWVKLIKNL